MTTGTVHTFDTHRGTGSVRTATGAVFPFSSRDALASGDAVTFHLVGGIAGVYALDVAPTSAPAVTPRPTSRIAFARPALGGLAVG